MNCEDFEILMADALGDELSPADRPAFEVHLAECATCREEFDSNQKALGTMRALPGPRRVNVRREGNRLVIEEPRAANSSTVTRRQRWLTALAARGVFRYAASVLIAFTAGYAVHAGMMAADKAGQQPVTRLEKSPPADGSFQHVLLSTHARKPSTSDLAKCLIAMARVQR